MEIIIKDNYEELSRNAAEYIGKYIIENPGRLLCFAAGETPLGTFSELIRLQEEGRLDLSSMYYVGLDEWVGLGYEDAGSCRQVMFDYFYNAAGIPGENILTFDGRDKSIGGQCKRVNAWIGDKGGIGLTLLGIGMNGHLGFNEPGTEIAEDCLVVGLDQITLEVGKKYFNGADCPDKGVTVGLGHLLNAEKAVLIAIGETKSDIVKKALEGDQTVGVPASYLQRHKSCCCFLDKAAALLLEKRSN